MASLHSDVGVNININPNIRPHTRDGVMVDSPVVEYQGGQMLQGSNSNANIIKSRDLLNSR